MKYLRVIMVSIYLFVNDIESIIRNDITNRCLHIGYLGRQQVNESLYATTCTWNSAEGTQSHLDEWLEIQPSEIPGRKWIKIQKVTNASRRTACLATVNNQPGVSYHCSAPEASFELDIVHQRNFKGSLTSYSSFKIRNTARQCLTVRPGHPFLQFRECSPRQGLFQIWSVCRHNKVCDVDLTWTPRHIVFPKNSSDVTSDYGTLIASNYSQEVKTVSKEHPTKEALVKSVIINEVLYTIQNAVRIYESSENFLVNGIAAFYTHESLSEAHLVLRNLCTDENLQCNLCVHSEGGRRSPNQTVTWLMKWISECNTSPAKSFLSGDVLQVPHHLFPSHDPSHLRVLPLMEKYKLIIPNLRKYLNELETQIYKVDTSANSSHDYQGNATDSNFTNVPMHGQGQKFDPETQTKPDIPNSNIPDAQQHEKNATQDYLSIIDVRLSNG